MAGPEALAIAREEELRLDVPKTRAGRFRIVTPACCITTMGTRFAVRIGEMRNDEAMKEKKGKNQKGAMKMKKNNLLIGSGILGSGILAAVVYVQVLDGSVRVENTAGAVVVKAGRQTKVESNAKPRDPHLIGKATEGDRSLRRRAGRIGSPLWKRRYRS